MIFGIAFASVFIFQGLRILSQFVFLFFQWRNSQSWPATRGVIVQSNLQNMFVPRGGKKSHNTDGSVRMTTAYNPDIVYEYRVTGVSFQSSQLFLGQRFPSTLNVSNSFVERYPAGRDVTVYYDPEKPALSVLERNRFNELLWYLAGGIIYILVGFAVLTQVLND